MAYIILLVIFSILAVVSFCLAFVILAYREDARGLWLFIPFAVFIAGIIFTCNRYEKTPEHLKSHELSLIRNIEEAQKKLEHFYIDHPEFRGD